MRCEVALSRDGPRAPPRSATARAAGAPPRAGRGVGDLSDRAPSPSPRASPCATAPRRPSCGASAGAAARRHVSHEAFRECVDCDHREPGPPERCPPVDHTWARRAARLVAPDRAGRVREEPLRRLSRHRRRGDRSRSRVSHGVGSRARDALLRRGLGALDFERAEEPIAANRTPTTGTARSRLSIRPARAAAARHDPYAPASTTSASSWRDRLRRCGLRQAARAGRRGERAAPLPGVQPGLLRHVLLGPDGIRSSSWRGKAKRDEIVAGWDAR